MNRKPAAVIFLVVCVVLAFLMLTQIITLVISGALFAITLVALGLLSQGFKRKGT